MFTFTLVGKYHALPKVCRLRYMRLICPVTVLKLVFEEVREGEKFSGGEVGVADTCHVTTTMDLRRRTRSDELDTDGRRETRDDGGGDRRRQRATSSYINHPEEEGHSLNHHGFHFFSCWKHRSIASGEEAPYKPSE